MKKLTNNSVLHFWIYFITLIIAFANLANAQELKLILRTSPDIGVSDCRYMAIGWAPEGFWVPSPPAPPGDAFYLYTANTYRFKDIRTFEKNMVYEWEIDFHLAYNQDSQNLYFNREQIINNAEYAVILDVNDNILYDLSQEEIVELTPELNGRFKVQMLPKGSLNAPFKLNDRPIIETINPEASTVEIELNHVFVNLNSFPSNYSVENSDQPVSYAIQGNKLVVETNSISTDEVNMTIKASNPLGFDKAEITLKKSTVTSLDDEDQPNEVNLAQNYPNPFNPSTTISYYLPATSEVQLTVYNTSGQVVSQLVNGPQVSGSHSVQFDASTLPSGIYIYRLVSAGSVITKKMSLVK